MEERNTCGGCERMKYSKDFGMKLCKCKPRPNHRRHVKRAWRDSSNSDSLKTWARYYENGRAWLLRKKQ